MAECGQQTGKGIPMESLTSPTQGNTGGQLMNALQETEITCPYCGEYLSVLLDPSEADQEYIEDCQVCCRPIVFNPSIDEQGHLVLSVHDENDAY